MGIPKWSGVPNSMTAESDDITHVQMYYIHLLYVLQMYRYFICTLYVVVYDNVCIDMQVCT